MRANLLENAVVHANSEKNVKLFIEADDENVIFHIKDYGIGLSICKTIIHAHHGNIYARNHAKGAEFIFTLPREETAAELAMFCQSAAVSQPSKENNSSSSFLERELINTSFASITDSESSFFFLCNL